MFIIVADRGDYSDHVTYTVAYSPSRATAELTAVHLTAKSREMQRRVNDTNTLSYVERWEAAYAELGDPQWSPGDETIYGVQELFEANPFVLPERHELVKLYMAHCQCQRPDEDQSESSHGPTCDLAILSVIKLALDRSAPGHWLAQYQCLELIKDESLCRT